MLLVFWGEICNKFDSVYTELGIIISLQKYHSGRIICVEARNEERAMRKLNSNLIIESF
jgi:hypothetical protein